MIQRNNASTIKMFLLQINMAIIIYMWIQNKPPSPDMKTNTGGNNQMKIPHLNISVSASIISNRVKSRRKKNRTNSVIENNT